MLYLYGAFQVIQGSLEQNMFGVDKSVNHFIDSILSSLWFLKSCKTRDICWSLFHKAQDQVVFLSPPERSVFYTKD